MDHTRDVLSDVLIERRRQEGLFPGQILPYGNDARYTARAKFARDDCDEAFRYGGGTWLDVLTEEFWEAFSETDPTKLRAELIQVAAVAVRMVEQIDRETVGGE